MVKAIWNDTLLAESDATVVVDGNHYFPQAALRMEHLEPSETTSVCGWKGTARYYHVVAGGKTNRDAAWYYPETRPEADHIEGRVAFWNGVEVG